jgi:hypothetical protein
LVLLVLSVVYRGWGYVYISNVEFRVFWDVAPCSHIEVDLHFSGAYCLHHQGDDGGSTSVSFNVTTWRYIPEDFKLHTRHCEN